MRHASAMRGELAHDVHALEADAGVREPLPASADRAIIFV
jgi:hypothetical protein